MVYIFLVISIVLLFIIVFSSIQFYNIVFKGFAPFISTKFNAILTILKELDLTGEEKVYELGSGSAGFLRAVEEKFNITKLIGVEYSLFPYFIAKIQLMLVNSDIKLVRKNLFKIPLNDADIIYCFLSPEMMRDLEKKFTKECRSGTLIISYHFKMPNLDPEKIIKEGEDNIYFYRI